MRAPPVDRRSGCTRNQDGCLFAEDATRSSATNSGVVGAPNGARPRRFCPATGVHIELLDGFACYAQGTAVDLAPSAERLLAFVAVQGSRVGRGIVIAALWPDRDDQRGGGNLRSVIWRLPESVRSAVCLHNGEVSLADASCDVVELVASRAPVARGQANAR